MKNRLFFIFIGLIFAVIGGCAPKFQAPKSADGDPVTLYFYCDNGITEKTDKKLAEQINEVSAFMKLHFLGLSTKAGYRSIVTENRNDFIEGSSQYLVDVKIKKYDAGSKALRMTIGFGAGAVSMDTHYALYADKKSPLLSKDDGVGSSNPNWIVVPAKLNEKMLIEITKEIKGRI